MDKDKLKQFLNLFFDKNEKINIRLIKEDEAEKKIKTGFVYNDVKMGFKTVNGFDWDINRDNNQGYGVFFAPNSGGLKSEEITRINAHFVDVDLYKQELGVFDSAEEAYEYVNNLNERETRDYATIDAINFKDKIKVIAKLKLDVLKIEKEDYLSTYELLGDERVSIISTHSGFHLYFHLKGNSKYNPSQKSRVGRNFKTIQRNLAHYFSADSQIINEARLMRLPETKHMKYSENNPVTKVIQTASKKWTINELKKAYIPQTKGLIKKEVIIPSRFGNSFVKRTITQARETDLIWKKKQRLTMDSPEMELIEFDQYVKSLDFSELITNFPTDEQILCPFHDDTSPSATVFDSQNGEKLFYCHACFEEGAAKNIVTIYGEVHNKSYYQSLEELARILGIHLPMTKYKQFLTKMREENDNFIIDLKLGELADYEFKDYQELMFYFNTRRTALLQFLTMFWINRANEELVDKNGESIFFVSLNEITRFFTDLIETDDPNIEYKESRPSKTTIYNDIRILSLLGFIERIPFDDVPEKYREKSIEEAKNTSRLVREYYKDTQNTLKNFTANEINYYKINYYEDNFEEILEISKKMKDRKIRIMDLSQAHLQQHFDYSIVKRVYPDYKEMRYHDALVERVYSILIKNIDEKGYSTLDDFRNIRLKRNRKELTIEEKNEVLKEFRSVFKKRRIQSNIIRSKDKKNKLNYSGKETSVYVFFKNGEDPFN